MPFDTGVSVTLAVTALGGVIWLIRLEGRVNTQSALHTALKDDVQYIRERIDQALLKR